MSQACLSPGAPTPHAFEDLGLSSAPRLSASLFAMQPELCICFRQICGLLDDFGESAEFLERQVSINCLARLGVRLDVQD